MGADNSSLAPAIVHSLSDTTGFTETEIRDLYRLFRSMCMQFHKKERLVLTPKMVENLYNDSFDGRNTVDFSTHLFRTMDPTDKGTVNFAAFIKCLNIHLKGTFEDKAGWCFDLFNTDGDGVVTTEEALDVIQSYFELQANKLPMERDLTPVQFRDKLFKKAKAEVTKQVDKKRFITACNDSRSIKTLVDVLSAAAAEPYHNHKQKTGSFGRRRATTIIVPEQHLVERVTGNSPKSSPAVSKRRTMSSVN